MLKHETMIENVHRRIAQYEEEKKMKHSKFKKIISAIKPETKTNKTSEEEYIEVESNTERLNGSNRIMRIVSTMAAGAVLISGLGATGYMLHKNKAKNIDLSEVAEPTQSTKDASDAAAEPASVSPFGDFNQIYFWFDSDYYDDPYLNDPDHIGESLSNDTYDRIAKYLNAFNWGEGREIAVEDVPDFANYDGKGYYISWKTGDVYSDVLITEDGKVYYVARKCTPRGESFDYPIIESKVYDIDFATFKKDIDEILIQNVTDSNDMLTPRDIKRLSEGEFLSAELKYEMDGNSAKKLPDDDAAKKSIEIFLRDDLLSMLRRSSSISSFDNELMYTAVRYFKTTDTVTRRETYFIYNDGTVSLCSYDVLNTGENIPTGTEYFHVDINAFEKKLNEALTHKYEEKAPEKTEDKKDSNNSENVQTTTESSNKSENIQTTTENSKNENKPANDEKPGQETNGREDQPAIPEENENEDVYNVYTLTKPGVYIYDENNKIIATPKTHNVEMLDNFVKEKLDPVIEKHTSLTTYSDSNIPLCSVLRIYKDNDGNLKYSDFLIYDNGQILVYFYEYGNYEYGYYANEEKTWIPHGSDGSALDYEEFRTALDQLLKDSAL